MIKCIKSECKKDIPFEAFVEYFTQKENLMELTVINDEAFKHYLAHHDDIRSCPTTNCVYRGYINMKSCRDSL